MSASMMAAPSSYAAPRVVTYAAEPQVMSYSMSSPAYTMGSQMAMDWGTAGVPITSMAYPRAGGSVSAPQTVSAAPHLYACPPEIFAKLAQGGSLTPAETALLTGQAAPAPVVETVPEAPAPAVVLPAGAVSSTKASASKKKSSKKDSLKASKKSKAGCC
mmetsp:Transcript_27221/g.68845  ORF Transcript_27221/g.68845 Transcript_27221/m.68845 type:complete len:160 (-) Transcript_27221:254-733(-)